MSWDLPWMRRQFITGLHLGQIIIHTYGQFSEVGSPKPLNVFGLREDTREPGENTCRCGENMQTPCRKALF